MTVKRNGSLDFIKFLLAISIIMFHGKALFPDAVNPPFFRGAFAVEGFFVIAGYFMAKSAVTKKTDPRLYIWSRYKSLFPYHVFAFVPSFITVCILKGYFHLPFKQALVNIAERCVLAVPEFLLFAPLAGMQYLASVSGIEWYLSAMLLSMALLYPLIRRWPEQMCTYVAPLIFLFLSGYLRLSLGSYMGTYDDNGILCYGLLRALATMSLGAVAYRASVSYAAWVDSNSQRRLLTTCGALFCWIVVFVYMYNQIPKYYDFAVIYFVGAATLLSSTGLSYLARPLSNRFVYFLGKISLPFFLNQGWIRKLLLHWEVCSKYSLTYAQGILLFIGLTLAASLLCILVMDYIPALIRKAGRK